MNKWFKPLVTAALGCVLLGGYSAYAASPSPNQVFIDGQLQNGAIMVEGRTLVQLRALDDPAWLPSEG